MILNHCDRGHVGGKFGFGKIGMGIHERIPPSQFLLYKSLILLI